MVDCLVASSTLLVTLSGTAVHLCWTPLAAESSHEEDHHLNLV